MAQAGDIHQINTAAPPSIHSIEMERRVCGEAGAETVRIIAAQEYSVEGTIVDLRADLQKTTTESKLYTPSELSSLQAPTRPSKETVIEVTSETTLAAAKRCLDYGLSVTALNFASAKNPGGGFRSGARSQEESIARSSTLYASLMANERYYRANKPTKDCIYTDHLIWSPSVTVFRAEDLCLLPCPWNLNLITMPATNAKGAKNRWRGEETFDEANARIMRRRIKAVLTVAALHNQVLQLDDRAISQTRGQPFRSMECLLLGAWGCGAFGNDPVAMARLFKEALSTDAFKAAFTRVVFPVFVGRPAEDLSLKAFRDAFIDRM